MSPPAPDNPLDAWIAARLGSAGRLTRADLVACQTVRLAETFAWARQHSPFYRRLFADIDAPASLDDLRRLPFTTADDLRRNDPPLLCVSQSEISHVVTLDTSGTSGPPKRLFFTADDLEATTDFFRHGMSVFTRPGDRVAILFPGARPGSVGDLLAEALRRLGAVPIAAGWPQDTAATAALLERERPDVVAGAPVAVLAVARHAPQLRVRAALLSSDHAAASLRAALERLWGCEIFDHYGMTETGLGGGVECGAHAGCHMRDHELLVEIVRPDSGEPVAPGEIGEVVFTTLVRRGLPLIRYRSGDLSRLLPGACACGSPLARLERIRGRIGEGIAFGTGQLRMAALDEALFARPEVVDFSASFRPGPPPGLHLDIACLRDGDAAALRAAIECVAPLRDLRISLAVSDDGRLKSRVGKRRIVLDNAP